MGHTVSQWAGGAHGHEGICFLESGHMSAIFQLLNYLCLVGTQNLLCNAHFFLRQPFGKGPPSTETEAQNVKALLKCVVPFQCLKLAFTNQHTDFVFPHQSELSA